MGSVLSSGIEPVPSGERSRFLSFRSCVLRPSQGTGRRRRIPRRSGDGRAEGGSKGGHSRVPFFCSRVPGPRARPLGFGIECVLFPIVRDVPGSFAAPVPRLASPFLLAWRCPPARNLKTRGFPPFLSRPDACTGRIGRSSSFDSFFVLGTRMGCGPVIVFHRNVGSVWHPEDARRALFGLRMGSEHAVRDAFTFCLTTRVLRRNTL